MRLLPIFKTLLVLTVAVVGIASRMDAAAIKYTITFTGGTPLPTSGSFKYDATSFTFTDFTVDWSGYTFDLTVAASFPYINPGAGVSACLSGATGAEATFLVLSSSPGSECRGIESGWHALVSPEWSGFLFSTVWADGSWMRVPPVAYVPDLETFPGSGGWSIAEESAVPEPSTFIQITLAGVLLARKRRAARERRSLIRPHDDSRNL